MSAKVLNEKICSCTGNNRKRYADSSGIVFDVNTHSGKELHQFKLCGIELILSVLGTDNLVDKVFIYVMFPRPLLFSSYHTSCLLF